MLNIPEEIKMLFRADNLNRPTEKKIKLIFYDDKIETLYPYETLFPDENLFPSEHGEPWIVIENDRIDSESLTITEALSESEELQFGSCESAMMEIVVADVIENIIEREFTLTIEIGGYEMPLGIFTVSSFVRQADRRKRKITAYDRMRWFDRDVSQWYNELSFPMTLKSFRDYLCDYIGVRQVETDLIFDSLEITKTIEPQEISGLEIMKSICELNGCFGHINKFGEFFYIKLPETGLYPSEDLFPSEDLYPSELGGGGEPTEYVNTYRSLLYEDYIVEPITSLSIREQEGDIGANVGDGENVYVVEGNFLAYGKNPVQLLEIAETLLPVISNRIYKPASLECNAMPWIEVGDSIRIITRDEIVDTFVMNRVTTGCQAMVDSIESSGSQRREEVFGINKQIIQLEGKSAVIIKNVEEVSVRITDLKAQEEAHFKITSEAIEAEVTRATEEEGKLSGRITVEADRITSEVSRATKAEGTLSTRITQTATEILAEVESADSNLSIRIDGAENKIASKVSKGTVSSEISQEPDKVTISANRLVVNSTHFKLDGNGNATFSGTVQAATIKSSTLTGGSLYIDGKISSPQVLYPYWFSVDESGFAWDSINSSMTKDGTLTAKNGKFSGSIEAANITGSTITGNTINGGTITGTTISGGKISGSVVEGTQFFGKNEAPFTAAGGQVWVGDFYVDANEYGRGIFQSYDEVNGISTGDAEEGRYYLWAGYGNGAYGLDSLFAVNTSQVHTVREFYIHGPYGTINVYDKIRELMNGGGGSGCGCDGEIECECDGDIGCSGHTPCYTCSGYHEGCGPATGVAE